MCSPCNNCLPPSLSPLPLPSLHASRFCLLAPNKGIPWLPHLKLPTAPHPCPPPPHPHTTHPPLLFPSTTLSLSLPKCLLLPILTDSLSSHELVHLHRRAAGPILIPLLPAALLPRPLTLPLSLMCVWSFVCCVVCFSLVFIFSEAELV